MIALALLLQLLPAGSAQAALSSPTGLKAASTSSTAVSLGWNAVSSAAKYRVQYSSSPTFSKAQYIRVVGNELDVTKLAPRTRYYFRVRVITASGTNVSDYSKALTVETASPSGYSHLAPIAVSVKSTTSSSVALSWRSRGSGIRYRVQYSTSPTMAGAKYLRFTPPYATISGLGAGTAHYFRVRAISNGGASLSGYSNPVRGNTAAATNASRPGGSKAPLRVVSYNVQCANCSSGIANEQPWNDRRHAVVASLLKQNPDVMGIQEASQGWLRDASGKTLDLSQFEDLERRLGSTYRLTNVHRNNCEKSTTPTRCVPANRGASKGTKIIYNSARLKLIDQGSRKLSAISSADNERYVAWAILQQKSTGKKFFFTSTHLEKNPDSSGSTAYYRLRRTQAGEIVKEIAKHNRQKLPVISVGDFNSNKFVSPSNAVYDTMTAAGLTDPLGNGHRSTKTAPGATVEKRINTHFYSFNGYRRAAPQRADWVNGSYIDYIFTTRMRVSEYENVVNVNASGNFVGTIPSDHNLQRATVYLP